MQSALPDYPEPACGQAAEQWHRARQAMDEGRLDAAAGALERVLEVVPDHVGAWHGLGTVYCQLERWEDAQAAFEHGLQLRPLDPELLYRTGICQAQADRIQQAVKTLEQAVSASGHLRARFQLGLLYARRRRTRQKAIDQLEAVLTAVDQGHAFEALDRVCFTLGSLYDDAPDSRTRAITAYRRGLAANPLSAVGHNSLGMLLMQSGQVLGALGEFKVAIQLDPAFRAPYTNLAHLLYHHVKRAELAQEYQHMIQEFGERAPQVLAHLSMELTERAVQQAYESVYTKGHQLKNLLGILGSRMRSAGRRQGESEKPEQELEVLLSMHRRVYDEWVGFLGAMRAEPVRPVLLEPARLVRRVCEVVRSQQWKSSVEVRVQEGIPRVEADEHMLREAVTNLCLNALEACEPAPGSKVTLGVGHDRERSGIFVEVEDDGPGIPPEQLEHIFDPGFTTKEGGNGYGLSIARRVAHAHHGELRVKSRLGKGTVFRLDIPLNFEDEEPGAQTARS